jgi:hypothetical protein
VDGLEIPAEAAKGVRGAHGIGTWYLWYLENRCVGSGRAAHTLFIIPWVLTDDGTATLGYKAISAGVGWGHILL